MKVTTYILLWMGLGLLSLTACDPPVVGCIDPRAKNFNAAADEAGDCNYYPLNIFWEHASTPTSNDTIRLGHTFTDVDGNPFILTSFSLMGNRLHLWESSTGREAISPSELILYQINTGAPTTVEDNFFTVRPESYSTFAAGWNQLGTFDRLTCTFGLPASRRSSNPSRVPNNHPLSATASPYLFDSTANGYYAAQIIIQQPNTMQEVKVQLFDEFSIDIPCLVTVVDGLEVKLDLRLSYEQVFAGISWTNDDQATLETKLRQNFSTAFIFF